MALSVSELVHSRQSLATSTRADHDAAIARVIAEMRVRLDEPLTLDDFAEMANYSPFHFARMFRQLVGIPPGEYLASLRFDRAKQLILQTDASITDICFEVGFSSLGTFSARFKHLVGVGPAELRAMPERLAPRLREFRCGQRPVVRQGAVLHGKVVTAEPRGGHLYVGLFPAAIPQAAPVSGVHRIGPGPFVLHGVPAGTYRLLAALYPDSSDPMDHLLTTDRLLVGSDPEPVVVYPGLGLMQRTVAMRPLLPSDPPILTVLPPLALGL